ncbi:MAG: helix-turn-helix domain-containing protein [Calditrichia bacterium]
MKVQLKAENIRELMARKNLSQNGLAIKLNTSSGYISQLLNGIRYPSPEMRKKFQMVFKDADFDDLFLLMNKKPTKKQKH